MTLNILRLLIAFFCFLGHIENTFSQNNDYPWFKRIDSTKSDISYFKYISKLDTTKGAIEYDENNKIEDIEPTFADRYFKNIQVDTTQRTAITKAITAKTIMLALMLEKYGKQAVDTIKDYKIVMIDNLAWAIICNIEKQNLEGSLIIVISRFDGKILRWSRF